MERNNMKKIYNQKAVAVNKASVGDANGGAFTYKGFNSKNKEKGFKLYDIDLVKQDIINHFYIRKGEKLENPTFGTIIWDMIFEQFTDETKTLIAKDVETIINYDPRIAVQSVSVDSTEQGMRIEAEVVYIPFNISERMTFNFDRNNSVIN
jgi:phage baseplate assembly protein W